MAQAELTPQLAFLEEAIIVLPNRRHLLPAQPQRAPYETVKELSNSEVMTLALFRQLRGIES
jgi:hypothetical protein